MLDNGEPEGGLGIGCTEECENYVGGSDRDVSSLASGGQGDHFVVPSGGGMCG